ncbi:DegT/DnrJ/EryC1/StrS family aminotransferase [Gammaproteobacteria bacterium]|nr:DegT/DnrJ/EryC1/StrS family aminotransferase [Gammaproteobacteria bacterium]
MKIREKRIPSAGPSITKKEIDKVSEAIEVGWGSKMNFYIDSFVDQFSEFTGIEYCLPTAHCTDAIHLSLLSQGIKSGDEVIVPDLSWVASASPITYVQATPVFVDVDPVSLCIDTKSIENAITKKTKAIMAVDLIGNMPDWDEVQKIADTNNLILIEDAAEGIGATYKNKKAGSFGDVSLFSFNATKLIMSGQGGMLCTNDEEIYLKAKLFSHQGIKKEPGHEYFWSTEVGYNYNWTNIQAALALAQLERIDELIQYKEWLFRKYEEHLSDIEGIRLNQNHLTVDPCFWMTIAIVDENLGLSKQELVRQFDKYNIDIRPMFYPISSMPPYQKYINNSSENYNSNAISISARGICLPSGNNLTDEDVEYVCEAFKLILKKGK